MQSNEKTLERIKKFPRGIKQLIIIKSDLSARTVYNFFEGKSYTIKTQLKIQEALDTIEKELNL